MSDAIFSRLVRARKPHRCYECGGDIVKGDTYVRTSGVWDGRPASFSQCGVCAFIFSQANNAAECADEAPALGGLRDWFGAYYCAGMTREDWVLDMSQLTGVTVDMLRAFLMPQED